jgi:hypothetical protein
MPQSSGACTCVSCGVAQGSPSDQIWVEGASSTSPYTLSAVEIGAVIKGIRAARKDLDAPNFRHFRAARSADGQIYVCGWMNSKNSLGFYTADQPFVGKLSAGQFVVDRFGQDQLAMANVLDECRERGVGI